MYMKVLYFLPFVSVNLFAHVNNTFHYHFTYAFVELIFSFSYIFVCLILVFLIKAFYRRFYEN